MLNLALADFARLVRRRELLVAVAAVLVLHLAVFVQAFLITKANVEIATAVPPPPTGVEQFLAEQARYREAAFSEFSPPAAVRLMLSPGFPVLPVVAVLAAVISLGSDFEWGTIRGAVLLAGGRKRYLAARLLSLSFGLGLTGAALAIVGVCAPLVIGILTGVPLAWNPAGVPEALGSTLAAIATCVVYASVGLAVTTLARSLGLGLVASAVVVSADAFASMVIRPTSGTLASMTLAGSAGALAESLRSFDVVRPLAAVVWLAAAILVAMLSFSRRDLVE